MVDDVSGTEDIQRDIEDDVKDKAISETFYWQNLDFWDEYSTDELDIVSLFRHYVGLIAEWLEPDGSLRNVQLHMSYNQPRKIATALRDMGHDWVQATMVREAQRLRLGKEWRSMFVTDGESSVDDYDPIDIDTLLYGEV